MHEPLSNLLPRNLAKTNLQLLWTKLSSEGTRTQDRGYRLNSGDPESTQGTQTRARGPGLKLRDPDSVRGPGLKTGNLDSTQGTWTQLRGPNSSASWSTNRLCDLE